VIALVLTWTLLLAGGPSAESYDGLVARGLALGREGRFEDAGRAFDAAILETRRAPRRGANGAGSNSWRSITTGQRGIFR